LPRLEAIADFRGGSIALAAIVVLNDLLGNRLVERREFRASTDRCPADPDDRVHAQRLGTAAQRAAIESWAATREAGLVARDV
jgi:hypothetical protein